MASLMHRTLIFLLPAILCFLSFELHAQPSVQWTTRTNGSLNGWAAPSAVKSQAQDASGNIFVTGSASNGENADIITYKIDGITGLVLWVRIYNGSANSSDAGAAIAVDSSGNVVVTGYSVDTGQCRNFRTIKYNGVTGAELWNVSFDGGHCTDEATAVAVDPSGNVVVTGASTDTLQGGGNIRTIKYNGITGAELWSVAYNGSANSSDVGYAIAVDASGNVLVTGKSVDSGQDDNIRTIKYSSATGTEIWSAAYNGSFNWNDSGFAVAVDVSGNVVVLGHSWDVEQGNNVRTIKYSGASGVELWSVAYHGGGNNGDFGYALAVDPVGNVVVTGHSNDLVGGQNIRTIKYSGLTGAELWNVAYDFGGTNSFDGGGAVALDASGNVVVTGYSNGTGQGQDIRTVKYSGATGAELWSVAYNGSSNGFDRGYAVTIDANGSIVVTGFSEDIGQGGNIRTIKYDGLSGAQVWSSSEPTITAALVAQDPSTGKAMAVDANGNVVVTGVSFDTGEGANFRTIKYSGVTGAEIWNVAYNDTANGDDRPNAIAIDVDGNVLVTGYSTHASHGQIMRTIKYNGATGAEIWSMAYNGSAIFGDVASAIAVDSIGNVVVTGYSSDLGQSSNIRTIKYDGSTGAEVWSVAYNGSGNGFDYGTAIAVDASGNVFVTGRSADANERDNIRTIKYNGATGAQVWSVAYNGIGANSFDGGNGIAVDASGNVVVTGYSVEGAGGINSMRTIKYNGATGTELWNAGFNLSQGGQGHAVAMDASGNVVVTGYTFDVGQDRNIRTIKYDGVTGAEIWNRAFHGNGPGSDQGNSVVVDISGNVIVTGYSGDAAGGSNIRTIKYNGGTGAEMWSMAYDGGNGPDVGHAVATSGSNAVYIFGVSVEPGQPQGFLVQKLVEPTVPGAPSIGAVVAGNQQISVAFLPGGNGGSPILDYTATCSSMSPPGSFSATGTSSPIVVTGLTNGVAYTCTVTARNAIGISSASVASAPFTPSLPMYTLTVAKSGSGSSKGHVSILAGGINCGLDCSETLPANTRVSLYGASLPNAGVIVSGWSGIPCEQAWLPFVCTFTLSADTHVTASFSTLLTLSGNVNEVLPLGGARTVPYSLCAGDSPVAPGSVFAMYTTQAPAGTTAALVQLARDLNGNQLIDTGETFSVSGAFPGALAAGECVTILVRLSGISAANAGDIIRVNFGFNHPLMPPSEYVLSSLTATIGNSGVLSVQVAGSGSVSGPITNCTSLCTTGLNEGTVYQFSAIPTQGWNFTGWSGAMCQGGNNQPTCTVSFQFERTTNVTVTATFDLDISTNVAPKDLNDDGRSDLIWRDVADGAVQGWLMNGLSATQVAGLLPAGGYTITQVADLDGNGKADTLIRHTNGTTIGWLHDGLNVVGQATFFAAGSGWSIKHTADLNGDGKADLIVEHTDGTVVGWLMNGLSVTGTATFVPAGTGWSVSRVGDLNGDGKADLIWQNTNGTVQAWLMDGLSATQTATFVGAGTGWSVKLVGDFNGDNKADLVWQNTDGTVQAWLMDGAAITQVASFVPAGTGWSPVLAGDIDGDGKADLFWEHTDGRTQTWLMNGLTVTNLAGFAGAGGWKATHLLDLNGDGKRDVLWKHSDGSVQAWLLNGLTITQIASLAGPGTYVVIPPRE